MTQVEDGVSGLEDKIEDLNQISNKHEKIKSTGKSFWIIGIAEGDESQVSGIKHVLNKHIEENVHKQEKTHAYEYKKHTEYNIDKTRKKIPHSIPFLKH